MRPRRSSRDGKPSSGRLTHRHSARTSRSCTRSATRRKASSTRTTTSCRRSTRSPRPTAPAAAALNYRSEPFYDRLSLKPHEKAHSYASTVFGDPATIIPQGYLGDPTKFRVVHGGAEVFHIYHLHGGGDRWRTNPEADTDNNYADTGLKKAPGRDLRNPIASTPSTPVRARASTQRSKAAQAACSRLPATSCSIATSPSTTRRACGASGGCSTRCKPIWHRCPTVDAKPTAVTSAELIGRTMPNGTVITKDNLAAWITPQIPPHGIAIGDQDASVWDWTVDNSDPENPLYLGEPEPATAETPNFTEGVPGHFGSRPGDQFIGNRPVILFNPDNGQTRLPDVETSSRTTTTVCPEPALRCTRSGRDRPIGLQTLASTNPWLARPDGLCPARRAGEDLQRGRCAEPPWMSRHARATSKACCSRSPRTRRRCSAGSSRKNRWRSA